MAPSNPSSASQFYLHWITSISIQMCCCFSHFFHQLPPISLFLFAAKTPTRKLLLSGSISFPFSLTYSKQALILSMPVELVLSRSLVTAHG